MNGKSGIKTSEHGTEVIIINKNGEKKDRGN